MRKGNLIRNGDFESGNLDNWEERFWGLGYYTSGFGVESGVGYSSGKCMYCDILTNRDYYIGWDEVFDMEDVAGYIYGFYASPRMIEVDLCPTIYYYNEFNDNELAHSFYAHATSGWQPYQGFIRKMNEYSKISVGFMMDNASGNNRVRLDSFYLIPVYNISSVTFFRNWNRRAGEGNYYDYIWIFCVGLCKVSLTVHVYPHSTGLDSSVYVWLYPLTKDGHSIVTDHLYFTTIENAETMSWIGHDIAGVRLWTDINDSNSDYTVDYYLNIQPIGSGSGSDVIFG